MKTLLHLSDIHFGKTDGSVVRALALACAKTHPDLVVLSGDITQRARKSEFAAARDFLIALKEKGLTVCAIPGNHDIRPLYSPLKRTRSAYDRFNEFIAPVVSGSYIDAEIAVGNINTVRRSRLKGGQVARKDVSDAVEWFAAVPEKAVRIVVTHHPLDLPLSYPKRKLARRAAHGIYTLSKARIDLYLSGHYHRSSAIGTHIRYTKPHHAAVAVQAGTVSTRRRGERQSFNVIEIERKRMSVTHHLWDPTLKKFARSKTHHFTYEGGAWKSAAS